MNQTNNKFIPNCIFCQIAKHDVLSQKIYEDESTMAFLDISPTTRGHSLVIPKNHAENIYEIDDETIRAVSTTVQKVAKLLKKAMKADGMNIVQNNEPAGGQIVNHVHFHIIPRYNNDGLRHWPHKEATKEELEEVIRELYALKNESV